MTSPVCAFTLIELLVTIAVVAVVLGLVLIGLSRVRDRGTDARDLSSLRSHAQVFTAYAGDHGSDLPHFTRPGYQSTFLVVGGQVMAEDVSYFDAHQTWHMALSDNYYNSAPPWHQQFHAAGYFDAGVPVHWPRHTAFAFPCAFIADPNYWNPSSRLRPGIGNPDDPPQLRGTRLDEVIFPAHKTLLVQTWSRRTRASAASNTPQPAINAALADGSGTRIAPERRLPGYRSGDGFNEFYAFGTIHLTDSPPLLHTLDGVHGRDLR